MVPTVVVRGIKALDKSMQEFDKMVHDECRETLKTTIKQVAADAKANAPKDTGSYRNSIKAAMSRRGLIGWAYAAKDAEASKRGYLGHLLEYGTVKTPAQPHFGPALDKARMTFGAQLRAAMQRVQPKGGF